MERRDILASCAILIPPISTGCISSPGTRETETETESESLCSDSKSSQTGDSGNIRTNRNVGDFVDQYPNKKPKFELVVGSTQAKTQNIHSIRIYNNTGDGMVFDVIIGHIGKQIYSERIELIQESHISIAFPSPNCYDTVIRKENETRSFRERIQITPDRWDARGTQHNVYINKDDVKVEFVRLL